MPNVIVNGPSTINVRVNQDSKKVVSGSTTFIGASNVQEQVNYIEQLANTAIAIAQGAYDTANTKYDKTGGHVYGDVIVDNNLTIANTIFADTETIDAGTF